MKDVISRIDTLTPGVREVDFDAALHEQSGVLTEEARKQLVISYKDYLDKKFPAWKNRKQVLFHYPGINEDWQLLDPYRSVMDHLNKPDDKDTTGKNNFGVALIFPRTFEERASVLSQAGREYLGFEELNVALNDAGFKPRIFNAEQTGAKMKEIVDQVIAIGTKVAGINLTAMTARDGLKLAAALKHADPQIKIFLGGHHISLAVQEENVFDLPEFEAVDGIVVGKGDLSFPLAVNALRKNEPLDSIPDVLTKENFGRARIVNAWRAIPLSKFPMIRHVQLRGTEAKSARMSTSEGCIGNCSYCTSVKLYDRSYNPRAVNQIADEIEFLQREFGIDTIYFNDDIFIKPGRDGMKRANDFVDELENREIKINFRPLLRPDSIPFTEEGDALFRRLRENGMTMAFVGFESASANVLNLVNKMVDAANYRKFVERAREEKVSLQLGFIAWHPLMNPDDARQNFQFLFEADELFNFSVMVQKLDIFPGTKDKQRLTEAGLLPPDFNCLSDPQDYVFQDPHVGKLADSLNFVYKENGQIESFDKTIARLHLTEMPDLLRRAEKLLSEKPSLILSGGLKLLQTAHGQGITNINNLLADFIQGHLARYGQNMDLNQAVRESINFLMPQLIGQIQALQNTVDFLKTTCLRPTGKFEELIDYLFPWEKFPQRIDRNIIVADSGIPAILKKLESENIDFKIITDAGTAEAVLRIYPQLESTIKGNGVFLSGNETGLPELEIREAGVIVGLGGGIALDMAKQAANKQDRAMVLLPTILSTNAFSTPVTHSIVLEKSEKFVPSEIGRIPDLAVIDPEFLAQQSYHLNQLGLGDVVAVYSAGVDWQFAVNQEQSKFNQAIEWERQKILLDLAIPLNLNQAKEMVGLAELLTRLSYCTFVNEVGSNPASGSEKIFSSAALQILGNKVHHGKMMMLGTLIMTHLQDRDTDELFKLLKGAGFDFSLAASGLNREQLITILIASKKLSRQKGRATILDSYQLDHSEAQRIVDDLFRRGYLTD